MSTIDKPLIAVVGATSKQGRSVTATLLESRRFRVRALTRNGASPAARDLSTLGAEIVSVRPGPGHRADLVTAFTGADGAFLMTPPIAPPDASEFALGCELADAAVAAGVGHMVFSTLENVETISGGRHHAPHFTDKARIADHIRSLPVGHAFVMPAFFYTNILEYYLPRMEGDTLVLPIYLPEDFRAPFVDPLTATGPAVLDIFTNAGRYQGKTLPIVGDVLSPREMVDSFRHVTGVKAAYRNAHTRDGLLRYFPDLAANELLVQEILGMVAYVVDHGYFSKERDLDWSRRVDPGALTWEGFLRATGWRGDRTSFHHP